MGLIITTHSRISRDLRKGRESQLSNMVPSGSLFGPIVVVHRIYIHNVPSILAPTLKIMACGP
jgi:hypothetical protein